MPKPGRLYAAITHCRLSPTFEPAAADRLPRFLRSVAAPVMPYMTFNTVVRSRAVLTGPDTYTMINIHASEEAMRETIAGATDGRPEIEAILRNITILDRQSGPVEDIYHHAPLSSLRLLESNPEADPNLPFVVLTQYRIRPEAPEQPTRYATVAPELAPLLLPKAIEQGVVAAWLVDTGNDTIMVITSYATGADYQRAQETAIGDDPTRKRVARLLEPLSSHSGPALDIYRLAAETRAGDDPPPPKAHG